MELLHAYTLANALPMSAQPALFRKCLDEAVAAAAPLLGRCLDHALHALQEAESKSVRMAERHELSDAWRELQKQRAGWLQQFPRELKRAIATDGGFGTPSSPMPLTGFDALSLVDDAEVAQGIESARLSQLLLTAVEQPLHELDGLVSSALGHQAVRPEQNPVRPEVFAKTLRAMMAETASQPELPGLWTRHMSQVLGQELAQLYRQLAATLKQGDVQAVTYRVLPIQQSPAGVQRAPGTGSPQAAGPAGSGERAHGAHGASSGGHGSGGNGSSAGPAPPGNYASNDPRMRGGSAWADLTPYALGDDLIQEFLYRGGSHSQAPLAPSYYERVDAELAEVQAMPEREAPPVDPAWVQQIQELPVVDRPQRQVSTDTPLNSEVWGAYGGSRQRSLVRTQLKKQAGKVGQVLGLEVVRKLVNQVAQDPRLLAPVRESIVALEPSLLRLAMVDPRFFSEEQHAGRRLVERVAERSFKYNDEFSTEFKDFSDSVASTFNDLNSREQVSDAKPFQAALDKLEASWVAQDAQEEEQRSQVLDAVRFAEQRQAQADQIAWDLSQRSDLDDVPAVVQDFLYGPWALVMAHARLSDSSHIDPGGHGGVVTDLLWSVKREVTLRQPARLIEMIPSLLGRLRSGLAALGQTPQESEAFFETLEKLHRPVLQLRAKKRRDESDFAPLDPDIDTEPRASTERQKPKTGQAPWMGPRELDAAGFEDTLPTDQAELIELREHPPEPAQEAGAGADAAPAEEAALPDVDHIIASLHEGSWVDLYSKRRWLRAKLIWASTKGTLFMFVSQGGQPHSMTRRSCERLLRERLLRPVEMHGVVAHAIDALHQDKKSSPNSQPQPLAA